MFGSFLEATELFGVEGAGGVSCTEFGTCDIVKCIDVVGKGDEGVTDTVEAIEELSSCL